MSTELSERAQREREAYDEARVHERHHAWNYRVRHVLQQPNTVNAEAEFDRLTAEAVAGGGRALDVGCNDGTSSERVLDQGASYVLGFDIAETAIADANATKARPGTLEFVAHDGNEPIEGKFDLVFGRAVLHHLDFREFLERTWRDNLNPGGRIMFMEPLSHPFTLAFHKLVRSAHTPDERPLKPSDLRWMRERFGGLRLVPINLTSFATGILSTFVFEEADNPLNRAADKVDVALGRRPRLQPFYRHGIIVADKPR
jgi:2-polyprenyl-3-methyl-5-hydroxy-6-metoxy-1,4-benzoquinol methylase